MARRATVQAPQGSELTRAFEHVKGLEREVLRVYRPATEKQQSIHTSQARELLVRGGKRASKTLCAFIEFVSRVTGEPVIGIDGKPIPIKYRVSEPKNPLIYWMIGWDLKHIGQTIYRVLFEPGLFMCLRDEITGEWRAYNPAVPSDVAREEEARPCEPLIPSRMVVENSWSWDHSAGGQAEHVFRSVRLKNGAVIRTFPSSGKAPAQGQPVAGLLIDEDIQQPEFLEEWQDRLTDKDGWFLWSVWPHLSNFALVELLDRAEKDEVKDKPNIEAVQLLMSENPFIPKDAKERALERMGDDEKIARRDRGDLQLQSIQMYDFTPSLHGLGGYPARTLDGQPRNRRDVLDWHLIHQRRLPDDWTRYISIDPSHTRTAVLFGVVPPPEVMGVPMGRCIVVEDELIMKRASAAVLAEEIKRKIGTKTYEAFIMDRRMGQQTRVGSDYDVFMTYAEAFRKAKLYSRLSRNSFIPGCDRPSARYSAVREVLEGDVWPELYICVDNTPNTMKEFRSYRKKQDTITGITTIKDEPANPRKYDAMAALEYLVKYLVDAYAGHMAYVPPTSYPQVGSGAYMYAQRLLKQQDSFPGQSYVHLGPGGAA